MKKKIFSAFFLLHLSVGAYAGDVMTWDDCINVALDKNPVLKAAREQEKSRRYDYYGSFNRFLPSLSLSNSYSDSNSSTGLSRWQGDLSASMTLLSASNAADIRSSKASFSASTAAARQASVDLRNTLRRAFAQLLFEQERLAVSKIIVDLRERNAQLVKLRYESGRESKGNQLRAKAQALQAKVDFNQAQRDLRSTQRALGTELGIEEFDALRASGTLSVSQFPQSADTKSWLNKRPDLDVKRAEVSSAQAGLSKSKSSLWPSLAASYSRSRTGRLEFPNDNYSWSAGATLRYPLFGSGPTDTYFAIRSAARSLEKANEDFKAARLNALSELESTWSEFANTSESVDVSRALLEASRQRNEEADIRYASGLLSYDNWEIIATDRVNSERQYIQALLNAVNSESNWLKSTGKILGE